MRILFCTWQYFPVVAGGAERQARLQAEELVRRGHQVTVICPAASGVTNAPLGGVEVRRLWRASGRRLPLLRKVTYFMNLFRFVAVRGARFDVVHVHLANLQADTVVAAGRLSRLPAHLKVANSGVHGETRRLAALARITRWYGLRHAESVQALSEETRLELLRIGVRDKRIVRIPNGVPSEPEVVEGRDDAKAALNLPRDAGIVLFLGRFARYKGLADLLQAWREVARPGWILVLAGEDAEDEPFGDLPALPNVIVHPWTTVPRQYLRAADVFVLPSHSEGMSNALLEAMSVGTAIVTSDTGAAPEMIEDGVSGLIHPTGDVAELGVALEAVMSDEGLRERLSKGARERSRVFSVETVVDQLEDVYGRIARRSS